MLEGSTSTPRPARPDTEGRGSTLTHSIGWTIVACSIGALFTGAVSLGLSLALVVTCASASVVGGAAIALARQGREQRAALVLTGGSFAVVALGALLEGHVLARWNIALFAVVAIAALTLSGRAGFAAAGGGIALLTVLGVWPHSEPAIRVAPAAAVLAQGSTLLFVAFLLQISRGRMDRALVAVEQTARQIDTRNRELESERDRFRVLAESSRDLITEIDLSGNLLYASPNHEEVLGWKAEELLGDRWRKLIYPEDSTTLAIGDNAKPNEGGLKETTYRVQHRDGSVRWLESAGHTFTTSDGGTRLASVTRDVTRRVALETQLRHSQKLEAVGLLAGGVAHDFNNLLTVINLYSEMLLDDERFDGVPALREIHTAGQRAQALTRQLLAFSRKQAVEPRVLDLDDALRDVERLLLRLLGEHIVLSFHPSPDPLHVFIDPTELEQVVVNLAVNARDAMPEGGRLEIATRAEEVQLEGASEAKESWAVLDVRDDGVGMSEEMISRIFEPFYTTKEVGEGSGLGLAMVHGIVEQSGGQVQVDSEPDVGTCFRIYLRRVEASQSDELALPKEVLAAALPATVLLAEDDPAVRVLVQNILQGAGYRVIEASTGVEALAALQADDRKIDLLLTDVVMPEMGGRALREKLAKIRPGVPAVFMSGYPDRDSGGMPHELPQGDLAIGKPFKRTGLLTAVRDTIEGARAESEL